MGNGSRVIVGIYFNARSDQGGLYQYALTLIDCLSKFSPDIDVILYLATLENFPISINKSNWRLIKLPRLGIRLRMAIEMVLMLAARLGWECPFKLIPQFSQVGNSNPTMMIYVKPTLHVFQWPYSSIFPIHDLQHRLQPEFPEVSDRGEFRRREYLYTYSIPKASAILTDSITGKEDILACYGGDPDKIFALPYIPPTFRASDLLPERLMAVKDKYHLPNNFLFYPAAFWAHKNHLRLIRAVDLLNKRQGVQIPLVLTGKKIGEYPKIAALINELGLQEQIYFTGYIAENDLEAVYQQSLALVMPTFFGPTNIPVLEAWAAGCPVITSDIRGIREQVGDAGLLVDPRNEIAIADAIWKIYQSPDLRQDLARSGSIQVKQWTPELFAERLTEVIRFSLL
jgi:glycosyltransferase involved in cell wall biosynthesis